MTMPNSFEKDFAPTGFFAFRTPLLAYEELEAFSAGLAAPSAGDDPERIEQAVAADRALLRERLAALLARPEVLEAVFIASPSLFDGLEQWRSDPDGKKGLRAERAVVTLAKTEPVNPQAVIYLNRLSDLLFVMARSANDSGKADVLWVPGKAQTSSEPEA